MIATMRQGVSTSSEPLFSTVLDVVRTETGDATWRIRYRFDCIKIANHYEEEQARERETQKADPREKGEIGKGVATKGR
jgi:hypothetical protein